MKSVGFKKKFMRLICILLGVILVYQTGRTFFLKQERQIRNYLYEMVKLVFSDAWDDACAQYGLFCFNGPENPMHKCTGVVASGTIILIHGLDEPGLIFEPLASALDQKGYPVLFFFYPNDQNIDASSRLLFNNLSSLSFEGPVVIVVHSMGGLVVRHMLVDPRIGYAGARRAGNLVPEISEFIMAGTPNHGAFLSRFRLFMEIREQYLLASADKWHWLSALTDGTGAAGVDLMPQSDFMKQLNSRPFPKGIKCHMIAGLIFPFPADMPEQFQLTGNQTIAGLLPPKKNSFVSILDKAGLLIGDGLVPVNSAVPLNVPVTLVQANHKTMLDNWFSGHSRIPPAIPVILDILDNRE